MRRLNTGDPCPCCGQPIQLTDPSALELLTRICDMVGLPDLRPEPTYRNLVNIDNGAMRNYLRKEGVI